LNESTTLIVRAATLKGSKFLRKIKEKWDARQNGNKADAETGNRKGHAKA
jgi:hypothetical protein